MPNNFRYSRMICLLLCLRLLGCATTPKTVAKAEAEPRLIRMFQKDLCDPLVLRLPQMDKSNSARVKCYGMIQPCIKHSFDSVPNELTKEDLDALVKTKIVRCLIPVSMSIGTCYGKATQTCGEVVKNTCSHKVLPIFQSCMRNLQETHQEDLDNKAFVQAMVDQTVKCGGPEAVRAMSQQVTQARCPHVNSGYAH